MNIRNVLFPTDFSETAARAGQVAAGMAHDAGALLHVLSVCSSHWDHSRAAEEMEATADALTCDGLVVEAALTVGPPAAQIARYAHEHQVDLIVMGTHGRTGVSRALLGSVAEAVVRRAPCPVLTVPPASRGAEGAMASPTEAAPDARASTCIVCASLADDLICPTCRDRIRAEAVTTKRAVEQAGRRGLPV